MRRQAKQPLLYFGLGGIVAVAMTRSHLAPIPQHLVKMGSGARVRLFQHSSVADSGAHPPYGQQHKHPANLAIRFLNTARHCFVQRL